jgi:hypothetical protein
VAANQRAHASFQFLYVEHNHVVAIADRQMQAVTPSAAESTEWPHGSSK